MNHSLLDPLYAADPDVAEEFDRAIQEKDLALIAPVLSTCVDDIIWGLSQEISLGRAISMGYTALVRAELIPQISLYHEVLSTFGKQGPALGKIMADHLVPVLGLKDPALLDVFLHTVNVMSKKGTYTLYNPLEAMDHLCKGGDKDGILAYLELLEQTFSLDMTYKQCRPFTYTLPKAVVGFSPSKRAFQIRQLTRVIQKDFSLADDFLEGLSNGLVLLTETALDLFVTRGLGKYAKNRKLCAKFLSLGSKSGMDEFDALQVTVPLSQVKPGILKYIKARTGLSIPIQGLTALPGRFFKETDFHPMVCSDGKTIYLPEEINRFLTRQTNIALYKLLAKLETGYFEFHTFDFDLEKLKDKLGSHPLRIPTDPDISDFEGFLLNFNNRALAMDLFCIFEHGRIMDLTRKHYPGLYRKLLPILIDQWQITNSAASQGNPLWVLYQTIVLGIIQGGESLSHEGAAFIRLSQKLYRDKIPPDPRVETSALLVWRTYPHVEGLQNSNEQASFRPPFDRIILPDLFFHALSPMDQKALVLKNRLEKMGVRVYRSDLRKKLAANNGGLSASEIKEIILNARDPHGETSSQGPDHATVQRKTDLSQQDLAGILEQSGIIPIPTPEITGPVFYYKEWDHRLGDYLHHHTLVHEKPIPGKADSFYESTIHRHQGLIHRIRYAFELLRPEGLTVLRQWVEGDEFDYRALLDFALDKKAGIMPSDKLYIKKVKQHRDVAVLLLVDLSRSTANPVAGASETVLDVEKQAIVLFCEALQVVGDQYAVAGFSGTGRLGVDYFTIKDFGEPLSDGVRQKINGMAPQRSTRMGAAIRHATSRMEKIDAMVRLIIIMGDGFPNDVDYKKDYAVADTRKAILEARSKNIFTHALTVNIPGDPKLDDLYGPVHHHVIADVRELPDKLPGIYSALTRY